MKRKETQRNNFYICLYTDPISTANFKIHCRRSNTKNVVIQNDKREIHSDTEYFYIGIGGTPKLSIAVRVLARKPGDENFSQKQSFYA